MSGEARKVVRSRARRIDEAGEDALLAWYRTARTVPAKAQEMGVGKTAVKEAIQRAMDREEMKAVARWRTAGREARA